MNKQLVIFVIVTAISSLSYASKRTDQDVCYHGVATSLGLTKRMNITHAYYAEKKYKCSKEAPYPEKTCIVLKEVQTHCQKKRHCGISNEQIPRPENCPSNNTYLHFWYDIAEICSKNTIHHGGLALTFGDSWENEIVNSTEVFKGTGLPRAFSTCGRHNDMLSFINTDVWTPPPPLQSEEPNEFEELLELASTDPATATYKILHLIKDIKEVTPELMKSAVISVDQILTLNITNETNSITKDLNEAMLNLLETFGRNLVLPQNTSKFNMTSSKLALTVKDFNDSGINASFTQRAEINHWINGTNNFKVSIESNFSKYIASGEDSKVRVVVYSYETQELLNTKDNISEVVSVQLSVDENPLDDQEENVAVDFDSIPVYEQHEKLRNVLQEILVKTECVKYEKSGWTKIGCTTVTDGKHPICKCKTHQLQQSFFSILVSSKKVHADVALGYLTVTGIILTIIGLLVTIAIHSHYKELRQKKPTLALLNICSCLLISSVIFISSINATEHSRLCYIMAALLHYSLLCTWTWMSINAIKMYIALVKVISTGKRRIRSMCVIGYGCPFLIVATDLIASYIADLSKDTDDLFFESSYRSRYMCWLSGYSQYYGFLLPIGLMLFLNIISFVNIMLSLMHKLQSSQRKRRSARSQMLNAVYMNSVMGLTWLIGYLMLIEEDIYAFSTFSWIFCILNSTQGFTIFLLSCVRNEKVRNVWIKPFVDFLRNMKRKRLRKDLFYIELSTTLQRLSDGTHQLRRNTELTMVPLKRCTSCD